MILLLVFAFLSGLVTIFAPCIWPLLPIILSSSATGGHKKPLGITLGIMISFGLLTLTISYIVRIIPFDPNILRYIAVFIIGFLGLTLIVPKLSGILETYVSRISTKLNVSKEAGKTGFKSGFITGLALGIIWTPCAGPILATIATLAATQAVNLNVILVTVVYIIGVGIPLFIFATLGKVLFTKSRVLSKYTGRIQQIFGVIMILTALSIATNYDKIIQTKFLDIFPSYSTFLTKLESNSGVTRELNSLKGNKSSEAIDNNSLFNINTPAPDFIGINKWLNTDKPLTISSLKGKVVLVDFWTYTCINCIRTLPYVTSWYDKYKDLGFVVVGVHTPEFQFEHDTENVLNAIKMYNIHYPVAQDNNFLTWNNYNNQYWPAEYLIDSSGNIRRENFGEGDYDKTEATIQVLLKDAGKKADQKLTQMPDETPKDQLSPESYLGSGRMLYLSNIGTAGNGNQDFTLAKNLQVNNFSFGGNWNITNEYAVSLANAKLDYKFLANKVFLVIAPKEKADKIKVFLDGKVIADNASGKDVKNGEIILDNQRLYEIVSIKESLSNHLLHLEFESTGTKAYAFTFGE